MQKQLLVDYIPFVISKTMLNEVTEAMSKNGKLLVSGLLQTAETENQNGRIYPFEILQREVKKYEENFVKQNRALGELDHPECTRGTAKILTRSGWKCLKDIANDEEILTLNMETNKPEYQKITEKIDQP